MDMFMDKLAQRLNAQEIIKANTIAETEELNKLRNRVAEYNACLDKLAALIDKSSVKLENAQIEHVELKNGLESIQSGMDALKTSVAGSEVAESVKEVETLIKESKETLEAIQLGMVSIVSSLGDDVHKECVKVYRNVQAVVVEEGTKQNEKMELVDAKVNSVKGKAGAALGISIVTLVLVLCSVVIQVLEFLNISLF